MLSNILLFNKLWIDYIDLCLMKDVTEINSQKRGNIFESKVQTLINSFYNIPVYGGMSNTKQCRGINCHQFDIEFIYNNKKFWGECKFTDRNDADKISDAWSTIKDGLSKFVFAAFQRMEYERVIKKDDRDVCLILFTNIKLNRSIINDCIFNNVIFINPNQPYILLSLYLFKKLKRNLKKFNNQVIHDNLSNYSELMFNCKSITNNTMMIPENLVEDYFSFLHNNSFLKN
ncbi:MAG: hypothetical protein PHC34_09940 [Candidatus Gastranaerophilales bacterium]|nr:hypothetical protein [Candidatus Gastranaerophilales bacterium]